MKHLNQTKFSITEVLPLLIGISICHLFCFGISEKVIFFAFVAKSDGLTIGTGNGILNQNAGWVGNIIVEEKFRRRGIATAITRQIIQEFERRNFLSLLLISTRSGMPVYYKLGFKSSTNYCFYHSPNYPNKFKDGHFRKIRKTDHDKILAIDKFVTGENRKMLLATYISDGWVYAEREIFGFYLPQFGAGFIAATNVEAGLSLLRFKLSKPGQITVIPEENFMAAGFLEQTGCIETSIAPRMVMGEELNWHPEMIFSRAAGYCG